MSVKRELWSQQITGDHVPAWPCPKCGHAGLRISSGSLAVMEDRKTAGHSFYSGDEDTWFRSGRFSCILICPHRSCQELCAVAGDISIDHTGNDEESYDPTPRCLPKLITPGPQLISVPPLCPKEVATEIRAAFSLFWYDHAACLNRIRYAVEILLTKLGVPRFAVNKNHRRGPISLDSRISMLRSRRSEMAELCDRMLALKHLGNAGSHPGVKITKEDAFDAFDILSRLLACMYPEEDPDRSRLTKEINKRKGPRRKKV